MQRLLLVFSTLIAIGAPSMAQVIRCVDGAGAVSYTDDKSCPAGTRDSRQVMGAEATPPRATQDDNAARNLPAARAPAPTAMPQPLQPQAQVQPQSQPGGLVVIDPRAGAAPSQGTSRWSDRSTGPGGDVVIDDGSYGYPYPGAYPGAYPGGYPRGARPPRDMRPQLQSCGPSGCQDTLGNSYDRSGKLTQFQRPDGRTCQQVGTTQVCR